MFARSGLAPYRYGSMTSTPRAALAVPLSMALSVVLLVAHFSFTGDTYQDCRYLGPSLRMYVTAWAAPVAALTAAGLLFVRGLRGTSAIVSACLIPLLLLVQGIALWWTYAPDPAGGHDCSGLAVLTGLLT
jgi:hypothetical protein